MECQTIKSLILFAISALLFSSCYYDNVENVYGTNSCQSSVTTYSEDVSLILQTHCTACHGSAGTSGGLNLEGHTNASASALSGSLMNRVQRNAGDALLMPPNGPLSDCEQEKLRQWISEGAPNN
ncbi:MAG: hypothetical protein RL754_946 [Bacteroidota bacterium]|jgi:uncharacterized membrane protein